MTENKLHFALESTKKIAIQDLLDLGRKKGFVTYADISATLPPAEQDMDALESAFVRLMEAGIPVKENGFQPDKTDDSTAIEDKSDDSSSDQIDTDLLRDIETRDLVGLYLTDATNHELLSKEEEVSLAKRMECGLAAREELSEKKRRTAKERQELLDQIDDGWKARETLITSNTRLVISVAKKYMGYGVSFLDLIQEGNIGLMRAAKKFDYQRGYKFSTYATWWIRQAVTRALADQGRTIRVPVHLSEQLSKMFRTQHQLRQELDRDPTTEELAEALTVPTSKVQDMMRVAKHTLSLEMPTNHEGDAVLGDFIEDVESPDPNELATQALLAQNLNEILESLPPREVRVLRLRYGIPDGKKHTLREIGQKMGVTRERIRQIERQGLNRLRSPKVRRKLRSYLFGQ